MAVAPTEPSSLTDVDDTLGIVGHGGGVTGSWVTVTIPPAPNVTVPIRREPSFRSTPIAKVPGDAEEEATSIQVSLAVTGQLQPLGPVTVTFCIPAADVKLNDLGVTLGGELEPAACVMTTLVPPIVTVPDRRQPVFAVTVIVRLPADAELAALIQESLTVTGQLDELQPAPGDTVTDWLPPEAGKLNDVGVTSGGELEPAACVMTTRLPPIVTVPDRPQPAFAVTVIVRLPADTVLAALIQGSLTVTGQLEPQLAPPDTATDWLPPEAGKLNDLGVTSGGEPEPACVMTTRLPPIVTVPDRPQPVFARTVIAKLPADAEPPALIHESLTVTGQLELQLAPRDTVTDWLPPEAGKLNDLGVTSGGEPEPACVMTTRLPPIVTVPDRPQPVFARTVIAKLPADAEPPALIQGSLTVTGQIELQLAPRDTVTDWLPPEAGKLNDVGVTSGGEPEPACVMTTRLPPIVTVPDRPQPVFARTVIAKLPADAEPPALIQGSLTVTGQLELQLAPRDTVTDWLPPEAGKLNDLGVTSGGELEPAACVMTTRLPPIVTVPDRPQPVFARTVIAKLPADAEPPALIQGSLTVTGQLELQLAPRDTVTDWLPPEAGKLNDVGVTSGGELGPAACVMATLLPPIVTVPDRPQPVFALTVIAKLPADAEEATLIQVSLAVTGQLQPAGPVTDRLSVPPAAGNLNDDGVTLVGDVGHGTTMTGTSVPPIATVPDRSGGPGVTLTRTVPPADTVEGVAVIQA